MSNLPIDRETYVNANGETRKGLQYDMFNHIYNTSLNCRIEQNKIISAIDSRVKKIENRKKFDRAISIVAGAVVAAAAVVGKWVLPE